jgi:hypothetical protein
LLLHKKENAKRWYNEGTKTNGKMRSCVDPRERSYMEVKGGSGTERSLLLLVGVADTDGHTNDDTNNNDWK